VQFWIRSPSRKGVSRWGSDIGGYDTIADDPQLTPELLKRWIEFGAVSGVMRTKLSGIAIPSYTRPQIFDDDIVAVWRKYAKLHTQLYPYLRGADAQYRATGMPLMRALWLHYPTDRTARGMGSEYLWGRDLLIAPVYEKGATHRRVYLPAGIWYDWWTNMPLTGGTWENREVDLSTMPIYVRAGAIIPFDPIRQYAEQPVTAPTTLRIYPGADGDFTLYNDDGISQDYLKGKASWIRMTWDDAAHTLTLRPGAPAGMTSQPVHRRFAIRVMSQPGRPVKEVMYEGKPLKVKVD